MLWRWNTLKIGERVVSTDGWTGIVLATREACDVAGRAQISWTNNGEVSWIRADMVEPVTQARLYRPR